MPILTRIDSNLNIIILYYINFAKIFTNLFYSLAAGYSQLMQFTQLYYHVQLFCVLIL